MPEETLTATAPAATPVEAAPEVKVTDADLVTKVTNFKKPVATDNTYKEFDEISEEKCS